MNLRLTRDVTLTEVDTGAVLLDGRNGRYWQLNASGAVVLRRLLAGDQLSDVVAALATDAAVDGVRVRGDVTALVRALETAELVEVRS